MTSPSGPVRSTAARLLDSDPSLLEAAQVASALDTSLSTGLSGAEAARRLAEFGPNELAAAPRVPAWKRFLAQFRDPLVYLLLAATVVSVVAWAIERAHHPEAAEPLPIDALVIVLILIVNAVLGYVQEARAEQAVEALAQLSAPTASVLRDGQVQRVETASLVPGDILVLAEGDTISADGRLFTSASLRVAEASLTGESVPVAKSVGVLPVPKALGDRTNMVFNGTSVTQGTGRVVVTSAGMDTQVGKIAGLLAATEDEPTPLQKEMAHVSKALGLAVCAIAVLVLLVLALTQGFHTVSDVIESLLLAVSLAVAAVPEGLATILTVVLALGVQRMARHHAIVKKLSSVETLGSASVICSDKTGTLTRNEMTVERVVTAAGEARLSGTGYAPVGSLSGLDGAELAADSPLLAEVAATVGIGAFVNDAQLRPAAVADSEQADAAEGDSAEAWEMVGDPTEGALVVAAAKIGAGQAYQGLVRLAELPFTSERKRMSVVAADRAVAAGGVAAKPVSAVAASVVGDSAITPGSAPIGLPAAVAGELTVFSKGAPDVLLQACDRLLDGSAVRPLTAVDRQHILADVARLSSQAYRTLGSAYRPLGVTRLAEIPGVSGVSSMPPEAVPADGALAQAADIDLAGQADLIESQLIWTGMVGIIDPPRTEVRDSVAQAHQAGIRTVMITGDHPLTAARIAADLGIVEAVGQSTESVPPNSFAGSTGSAATLAVPAALTGDDLDAMSEEQLDQAAASVSVYARVAPEHKLKIVKSLQRQGNIVAMTGDGVNDAPAVKSADIGVAMGITGTEVTKEAAKMILADDNFSTIVAAVQEGRGIFDNIQKFLRFLLSSNVGEVLTVFGGVVFAGFLGLTQPGSLGITVPLLAVQLLWINLLTDAAPALAMGVDPQTDDVMGRPARRLTDRVIDREMWGDIIFVGLIMAVVTLLGMDLHLAGGLLTDGSVNGESHQVQMVFARTMGFTILVFAQLFNALASRSAHQSAFKGFFANRFLWAAILVSVALQVVVIYVPFLQDAFGTASLSLMDWVECILLASVVLWATELRKIWLRAGAK